jgi:succinate dehydrogenase/fumarate reductase flavoprotein subunit
MDGEDSVVNAPTAGERHLDADVVIVGGGIAGCVAAIQAAATGASVVVLDKTRSIRRSGDAGRGLAFLTTYLNLGEDWDTPEAFADWYVMIGDGLVDMDVAGPLAIEPLPAVCQLLEDVGVPLHNAEGGHDRVSRMWTPGPIVTKFDGSNIKPRLADRVQQTPGVTVVGGVHVTSVLADADGCAATVTGIDGRTTEFVTVSAGAVILATGSAERVLFNSPRRDPFNTYHVPYHGATGFALAARAGAALANIEFLGTFLFPHGFAAGAMGNLMEAGGRLVNGNGDLVAELPEVPTDRRFGHGLIGRAAAEVLAGRGPIYLDCTGLGADVLADLRSYLPYDAPLFLEFLDQSGIDLARNPVEFELFNGTWSATGSPKGVVVDAAAQTAVAGLFAAGDLATPVYALAGSLTSGWVAGAAAARLARSGGRRRASDEVIGRERERTLRPLTARPGRGAKFGWREFERELQETMTRYVGMDRNANGLRQAGHYLANYREAAADVAADNGHELMRAHEAFDLCLFDQMMTAAAAERDETRFNFVMGHRRSDCPNTDDATWKGVAVEVVADGPAPVVRRTVPNPWWRERTLAESAASAGAR